MANVSIHGPTGVLVVDGQKVFRSASRIRRRTMARAPSGEHAFQELANAGATMIRSGRPTGRSGASTTRSPPEKAIQDSAAAHGLQCWMRLGLPPICRRCRQRAAPAEGHRLPSRTIRRCAPTRASTSRATRSAARSGSARPASCARTSGSGRSIPNHPLVIIQAPRNPVVAADRRTGPRSTSPASTSTRSPTRPACTAATATPTSASSATSRTRSTRRRRQAVLDDAADRVERRRAVQGRRLVPRFPSLHEERFMAYQAIVNGARGLDFFGGHLTEVCTPTTPSSAGTGRSGGRRCARSCTSSPRAELRPARSSPTSRSRCVKPTTARMELVDRGGRRTTSS